MVVVHSQAMGMNAMVDKCQCSKYEPRTQTGLVARLERSQSMPRRCDVACSNVGRKPAKSSQGSCAVCVNLCSVDDAFPVCDSFGQCGASDLNDILGKCQPMDHEAHMKIGPQLRLRRSMSMPCVSIVACSKGSQKAAKSSGLCAQALASFAVNCCNYLSPPPNLKPWQLRPALNSDIPTIILDWDDTLFPTSALNKNALTHQLMRKHAKLIKQVLSAARSVAHVSIVTLAQSPWVTTSAKTHLPGLNVDQLLNDLDIKVHYAREFLVGGKVVEVRNESWSVEFTNRDDDELGLDCHWEYPCLLVDAVKPDGLVARWNIANPSGEVRVGDKIKIVEPFVEDPAMLPSSLRERLYWPAASIKLTLERRIVDRITPCARAKRQAMTRCLNDFYGTSNVHRNILGIGDAEADRLALKMATQEIRARDLCKTLKLPQRPSGEQLGKQLQTLLAWLPRLVEHGNHLDHDIADLAI